MPSLIQNFAGGLQSTLDIKGGDLPKWLADYVQATMDLTQFYLVNKQESIVFTGAAAAVDFTTFTDGTVPSGQIWYVWQYDVSATPGAGADCTIAPGVNFAGNGYCLGVPRAVPATKAVRVPSVVPFLAPPGSKFGFMCETQTLAPTVTGFALISRLRV